MLSPNVTIPFDGAHADIPVDFVRETALDGKFPKGAPNGDNPNVTGGNANHTHTSVASHNHSVGAHAHTGITTSSEHADGSMTDAPGAQDLYNGNHTHNFSVGSITSESVSSESVSYSSVSNNPPYYSVIFIKAVGHKPIPPDGMILSKETARPNLTFHSPSAGKFLRGAATGQDAGSIGGNSTNHHAIAHSHSVQHGHTGATGAPNSSHTDDSGNNLSPNSASNHTHPVTLNSTTVTSGDASDPGAQSETVEPAHRTLNAYINNSGNNIIPRSGDVALFLGNLSAIPAGWVLCNGSNGTVDMRDMFLKIPSSASASTTGGSNTHGHVAQAHTHTIPSHTHTGSIGASSDLNGTKKGRGPNWASYWTNTNSNPHAIDGSPSSVTASLNAANTAANSSDNQPEYRTVVYIMFKSAAYGGAALLKEKL